MPSGVTRGEFEARVGVLVREVDGEKLVTRHILEQTRRNSDDLAAIKTRLERVEDKVDGVEKKLDSLQVTVDGMVRDLPKIVGEAMRNTVSTRRGKR
jgi:uncharacterized protein YoxC